MCAGLRNFLALFQQFIADRAVDVAGVTGCRKRRFDRIANLRLVTSSRDHFLFNNDFVANRAMLAFRQARLGAGRSLCCVNDFGVPLGWNLCLCNDNLIADGAVLALSLAGFDASRLNSRINDLGMALGRDFFLGNEYSIADGAVLAFGQTSLRAGWSLCCIDYFCVAGRGDLFHTGENRITNGALRTGFMTSLGAGSGLFRNFNRSMSSRIYCFGLGCIANCAGVGLDTGVLTGRRGRDLASFQLWPLAGITSCALITVPQTEQLMPSVRPVSVQVAGLPATAFSVWPVAGSLPAQQELRCRRSSACPRSCRIWCRSARPLRQ
mgnify:CR=1 FL=1